MVLSLRIALFLSLLSFSRAVSLPVAESRTGAVQSESISLGGLDREHQYSFLYSVSPLSGFGEHGTVTVEVMQDGTLLAGKVLHAGDPDFYTQFRVPKAGPATVRILTAGTSGKYSLQVNRWPLTSSVRSGPINRWQDAMPVKLGATVFATGDDTAYIPAPGTPRNALGGESARTDWYRFEFRESSPKLIHLQVDLTERDQIPVHVTLHREKNAKLGEYYEGEDPVSLPHEVQALPGNKFTPRILKEPGTYYIAVRANHPEYKLRTRVYDVPPYKDPQTAVRTALDYILSAGDSWHANTPRRGGIVDRTEAVHQETSLCVGCHVTHFPLRAYLYATRNGYEVNTRQQLQFLTERFYNNPRPFYGFEQQGAVWARMISAPANVLGRMSHLMGIFEEQVSGERRERFHKGVAEYLRLYYDGRDKLPSDETNGNTPLVSAHEVAWYAWSVTKDPKLPEMVAAGEVKNTIDLCYQTLALAEMNRERYAPQLSKNVERLFGLQRPDGQWSARFEPGQAEVEFQTGHALWALHAAGVPATEPHVAKALQYLLSRQQPFGGWMDPLQSFENFRTPFRETQMAILALSAYYPRTGRAKGWNSPRITSLSADPVELLAQLDAVWDAPPAEVTEGIVAATRSNDALIRQAAAEALGRLGRAPDAALLGDPSKLVQRTVAWATRQAYVRHPEKDLAPLYAALTDAQDRVRWGAARLFAAHFSELAQHGALAQPLARLASSDPSPLIRTDAIKGLWQFWFWTPDTGTKAEIEDALLAALGQPQHPWVANNLRHAVYNLADENIRYLYNNWVPLLAKQEDRDRAVKGRLAVESRLSGKFAKVLETGSGAQKKELLRALTKLPLRRADVYDLEADLGKPAPPTYNRIGNDIEQITFFGESAERMARAVKPLLDSPDAEMRSLASQAVLLVRETRFADVNRLAGPAGENTKSVMAKIESIPEAVEVVRSLKPPPVNRTVPNPAGGAPIRKVKLDEAFFRGYVQPILEKRGKDGYACVHCHATHTQFDGTYGTTSNVVNPDQPEQSLILLKPTSTSESEGVVGANSLAHGGGVRWPQGSPEYVTILDWIKGAKE